MKRALLAACLCAVLSACAEENGPPPPEAPRPPPPVGHAPPFRPADFAWSAERGSAVIRGEVDYGRGGYSCAGQPVVLVPDAPYSRWRISQFYGSDERAALSVAEVRSRQANRPSDDYSAFSKHTSCDGQGHFLFQGLPTGSWYVIAVARPTGGQGQDMAIMRRVETRAGLARSIVLD
jgi:hypothetical protein